MATSSSKLFHRQGYISIKEYIADIEHMRKHGPWRLPLGLSDQFQFFLLSFLAKFSWFSDTLYIWYPHKWSPAYSVLVAHLQRKNILDGIVELDAHHSGQFFFFLKKDLRINEHVVSSSGQGVDGDVATAFSRALGELIERMVSGVYDRNKRILIATPDEAKKKLPILYPPLYHRFLPVQMKCYRELQHHPESPMEWVEGMNLVTRKKTYIPRQITSWFGFGEVRVFRDILQDPTSNGCAGYFTKSGAALRGLLEVISRDGFLVHWLTMIPPNIVKQDTLPQELQATIQEFKSRGVSLFILDVTSLLIPSVCIVAINEQAPLPQVVLSGASALTFESAIQEALREMTSMSVNVFFGSNDDEKHQHSYTLDPFISDINQETRQLYWRGAERVEKFRWFLKGVFVSYDDIRRKNVISGQDEVAQLRVCLEVLKNLGSDYYPVIYFPKNPVQQELGFYIAQVYIPKAFPLYLQEYKGTFESGRLQEFAVSKKVYHWKLNTLPHPFS